MKDLRDGAAAATQTLVCFAEHLSTSAPESMMCCQPECDSDAVDEITFRNHSPS